MGRPRTPARLRAEKKPSLPRLTALYLFPLLLYGGLIFYLSAQPPPEEMPFFPHVDKVAHVLEYGILGFLMARFLRALQGQRASLLLATLLCFGYGILDEVHQAFVAARTFSFLDMGADLLGSFLGAMAYRKINARWRDFRQKRAAKVEKKS